MFSFIYRRLTGGSTVFISIIYLFIYFALAI